MIAVASNEIGVVSLIGAGALTAFVGAMRYLKTTEDGTVANQARELAYLREEVATCRAESAQFRADLTTLRLRQGMLVGLLQRNGITIPKELH